MFSYSHVFCLWIPSDLSINPYLLLLCYLLISHGKSCFNRESKLSSHVLETYPVRAIAFIPYNRCIYCLGFRQCWTLFFIQTLPPQFSLDIQFLIIGPDFVAGFLRIPPCYGHPYLWLMVATAQPIEDFHRQTIAYARRTYSSSRQAVWPDGYLCVSIR